MEYYTVDVDEFSSIEELLDIPEEAQTHEKPSVRRNRKKWAPADIVELPGAIVYYVDMPGVKPGDINIHIEDGKVLFIKGERKRPEEIIDKASSDDQAKYLLLERRVGKITRRFLLPEDANLEAVTAECRDGVVTVKVGRKLQAEGKKRQVIEVKVGGD